MPIEFHRDPSDESIDMTVGDVPVPGVFKVEERGGGFTEQYKAEIESQSGGQDEADEPPAAVIKVEAYIEDETKEALEELRKQRDSFEVSIGPFGYTDMGIKDMEVLVEGQMTNSKKLNLTLQEFREVIIQERSWGDGSGPGGLTPQGTTATDSEVPAAWIDENLDGTDDRTGESIPNFDPDNDVIPLASGQREVVQNVRDGATFEHKIIDQSASGAGGQVRGHGGGYTIQHIGFRGESGSSGAGQHITGIIADGASGSTSTIRNVYMGDGAPMYNGDNGGTAFWVDSSASGRINVEFMHIAGWPDNGFYMRSPHNAEVVISNCYVRNCGVGNYSIGRQNCTVVDSVGIMDGGHGSHGGRDVYCYPPGPNTVRNYESYVELDGVVSYHVGANGDPSTLNAEDSGRNGGVTTRFGSTLNETGRREPDPTDFDVRIPGSPADAAAGLDEPEGDRGTSPSEEDDGSDEEEDDE